MIHVATIKFYTVDSVGNIVDKNSETTTLGSVMHSSTEPRIMQDSSIPNSTNYPTIKRYLELEDAAGFKLVHLSNTMVVTQQ